VDEERRKMNHLALMLLSFFVLGSLCSLEREASSVDYWDESILFEIEWPGKQKVITFMVL